MRKFILHEFEWGFTLRDDYRRIFSIVSKINGIRWTKKPGLCFLSVDAEFLLGETRFKIYDHWSEIIIEVADENFNKEDYLTLSHALNQVRPKWWWGLISSR